jgi:endonuclease YncB( thermonuclease family)
MHWKLLKRAYNQGLTPFYAIHIMTSSSLRKFSRYQRRWSKSTWILLLCLAISIAQYAIKREVSWITDGFLVIETSSVDLYGSAKYYLTGPSILPATYKYDLQGKVTRVKDGDTFVMRDSNGELHTIRLHGVDTPESRQQHGRAATQFLSQRINGRVVGVQTSGTDRYGRTIGTVFIGGSNINAELVCAGHGWWYQRYARSSRKLSACELKARQEKLGLWAEADPIAPWEYRKLGR